jgi:hypothetical protein
MEGVRPSGMYRDATRWLWRPVIGGGQLRWLLVVPIIILTPLVWALVTVAAVVVLGIVLFSWLEDLGRPKQSDSGSPPGG